MNARIVWTLDAVDQRARELAFLLSNPVLSRPTPTGRENAMVRAARAELHRAAEGYAREPLRAMNPA